ncbi:hypothetical protein EVG20_g7463 [Dentipellis fragilis]|uniref:FAD-binding domain-containing protein n=1 Tax=Dentipellis fragilis TaxID=205917 RepID=A0A4Y9YCR4_9AGAM|nr:hypothetical protein EVG20_g7463 [Dentipellis fragilis]
MSVHPPARAQVLVIGGGPSGSYAAAALAREGRDVVLLEAATFPRYHIGESLIPSVRHHLRFIDAEEKILIHGFARKPGAAIKFNQYKKEGYTDFVALGHNNASWNVVRSEFDEILLNHAASCGARVFQSTKVTSISFSPASGASDLGRPTSATWIHTPPDESVSCEGLCTGTIEFDYLIDASGRAGIMSTKYLKNRRFNDSLKNVAMWGYWADTGIYAKGSAAEGAPWFEALTDESGWAWFIPLHNGTTSVGVVMNKDAFSKHSRSRSTRGSPTPSPSSPTFGSFLWSGTPSPTTASAHSHSPPVSAGSDTPPPSPFSPPTPFSPATTVGSPGVSGGLGSRYLTALDLAPGVCKLIGRNGVLLQGKRGNGNGDTPSASLSQDRLAPPKTPQGKGRTNEFRVFSPTGEPMDSTTDRDETVRTASDYSYSASTYGGEGWRVIGDAGAFIDPFFSSGVHLAMTSGLAAAVSVAASIRGDCTEAEAAEWHSQRVAVSYTRFLVVVLSAYKQIRAQNMDVLSDVGEDNFDKAFASIRPLIQGSADLGPRLSELEVQQALDFCTDLFSPTTPEQHAAVRARLESLHLHEAVDPGGRGLAASSSNSMPGDNGMAASRTAGDSVTPGTPGGGGGGGGARPPLVGGRKRSGTIDTVMKWLGKVRGGGDSTEETAIPAPVSPPPRVNVPAAPTISDAVLRPRVDTMVKPHVNAPTPSDAALNVEAPVLAPAQLDEILQRVHPRRAGAGSLFIDTSLASTIGRPGMGRTPSSGTSGSGIGSGGLGLLPAPDIELTSVVSASASGSGTTLAPPPPGLGLGSLKEDAEEETRRVLSKINARRVIHRDHTGVHSLEEEALGGMAARLERGRLGLVRVTVEAGDVGVGAGAGEGEGGKEV